MKDTCESLLHFRHKLEPAVFSLVIVTGVSSVVTQIFTIREFLSQFQGNEIVISLVMFNWLMAGGAGTLVSHRASRLFAPSAGRLALLSVLLAALSVVQIPLIRILRHQLFISGASVGFYPVWLFTLLLTLPYCVLLGFVLPYSLFVLRNTFPQYPGARIYIYDNIGDTLGGVIFSTALVFLLTPVKAVIAANLPLLICACFLFPCRGINCVFTSMSCGIVLALLATFLIPAFWAVSHEFSTLDYSSGRVVHYVESKFGRVMITEDQGQVTLVQDGVPVFSSENMELAEESVHFLLAQIKNPARILLISAQGGMIREIEKYPVQEIDYVELDPEVSEAVFRYGLLEKTPSVRVIHQDGRAWLAGTDNKYDAIIVSLPEPDTFQLNRFYTLEFMKLARQRLTHGGGLGFSVAGYDSYVGGPELEKISSLFRTASMCFKNVLMLPGLRVFFICSDSGLNADIPELLKDRRIYARWVENWFAGNISKERIAGLRQAIDPMAMINTDLKPGLIRIMFQQWFLKFGASPALFASLLVLASLLYVTLTDRRQFVIFSTGAMVMGAETLVIFTFQAFYGYVYFLIGIIITVFLAGLMPGAIIGSRLNEKQCLPLLRYSDMALAAVMAFFVLWIKYHGGAHTPAWCFLLFGFLVSVLCGLQFPAALKLQGDTGSSVAGTLSADIVGAGLGALLVSLVLIPYGGFVVAGTGLVFLKILSLAVLLL